LLVVQGLADEHRQSLTDEMEELHQKVEALATRGERLVEQLAYGVMVLLVHAGKTDAETAEKWVNKYILDHKSEE
jgi:hypothetical protein